MSLLDLEDSVKFAVKEKQPIDFEQLNDKCKMLTRLLYVLLVPNLQNKALQTLRTSCPEDAPPNGLD